MAVDVRKPLKKFVPHLLAARDQNLNEADIVVRPIKVLEDVLGYDGLSEITREMNLKDKYVDLAEPPRDHRRAISVSSSFVVGQRS